MGQSAIERIGGAAALDVAVDVFYRKLRTDDTINRFFDNIDARMMKAIQKNFLIVAMGGPAGYTARDVRAAHAYLLEQGLDDSHVDAAIGHLKSTLADLRVPLPVAEQILATAGDVCSEIFNSRHC